MDMLRTLIGPDAGDANAAQLCVRAVIVLIFGIACIRIAGRRTFSQATPLDIIVALVVGGNLSRAMTGKAPFWAGLAATLLLVVLHRVVAWLTIRWPWLGKVVKAEPVILVRDGKADRKAMLRHGIGETDLMEGLRLQKVDAQKDVRLATLENNGHISVIPRRAPRGPAAPDTP